MPHVADGPETDIPARFLSPERWHKFLRRLLSRGGQVWKFHGADSCIWQQVLL
jgi:hypothetical protein